MIDQTHPRVIEVEEWRGIALELRRTGLGYREIAKELLRQGGPGSISRAHELVVEAINDVRAVNLETAKDIKDLELQRLDSMLEILTKKLGVAKIHPRSAARLVDTILHIMDRRARYLGLDAPKRIMNEGNPLAPLLPPGSVVVQFVRPGEPIPAPPETKPADAETKPPEPETPPAAPE